MVTYDKGDCLVSLEEELNKMGKYGVWAPWKLQDVPPDAKKIISTWNMKKKANGIYQARLNAKGCEKVEGLHYNTSNTTFLVTNDMSICFFMVLMLMAGWVAKILDMKGAFLYCKFD